MRYISIILTSLIRASLVFIISFVWLNDIIRNSYVSITVSIVVSMIVECIFLHFTKKKTAKIKTNKNDEKTKNKWQTILSLQSQITACKTIMSMLEKYEIVDKKSYVIITTTSTLVYPVFYKNSIQNIDINTAYNISKIEGVQNIEILCISIEDSAQNLASKIDDKNITLYDIDKVYDKYIRPHNPPLPSDIKLSDEKTKTRYEYADIIFNKQLIKNYIFGGILLFFTSFFTKYAIIYEIMGTVMIIFALVSIIKNQGKNAKH